MIASGLAVRAQALGRQAQALIEPTPEHSSRPSWTTSPKAHWGAIAAVDIFRVEVLTMHGLFRYSVLFAIALKTRCARTAGRPKAAGARGS